MAEIKTRKLVLENGAEFLGAPFGANAEALCEIVFNTSMVGYQEIASDPSYVGQAVVMTYPLIGNYGMTDDDYESRRACVGALIVRDYNPSPSNFRYTRTLGEILEENGIPGITGVDTRMITRMIRDQGAQAALLTDAATPHGECIERLKAYKTPTDHVARVSSKKLWYSRTANPMLNVVAVDCGIKSNIIKRLNERRVNVTVVPHSITAKEVLAMHPDGLFLSNGPGDPKDVPGLVQLVKDLRGRLPIFGICLGNQIIALAYGADTYKMKFGHRGGNHPVMNRLTGLVEITSQNHGYAIDRNSLAGTGLEETHVNLLDDTCEGVQNQKDMVCSVQYHPESAPGPQDSLSFFDRFVSMMIKNNQEKGGQA